MGFLGSEYHGEAFVVVGEFHHGRGGNLGAQVAHHGFGPKAEKGEYLVFAEAKGFHVVHFVVVVLKTLFLIFVNSRNRRH